MNQSVPNLYQLYALFYDFFDGAYVHHSEWNTKTQEYLQVTIYPNALPTEVTRILSPAEVFQYDPELVEDAAQGFNPQAFLTGSTPSQPELVWYPWPPPACR